MSVSANMIYNESYQPQQQKKISDMFSKYAYSKNSSSSSSPACLKEQCILCSSKPKSYLPSKMDIEIETNYIKKRGPFDTKVRLKKGCRVMCVINISKENEESYADCGIEKSEKFTKWEDSNSLLVCNGSMGVVESFETVEEKTESNGNGSGSGSGNTRIRKYPRVRFDHGITMTMKAHTWESDKHRGLKVCQVPLILAYALTIHKSQGATLDRARMDLGRDIFAYGQAYVALSRVRNLEGLYLMDFIANRIRANPKVKEFYEGFYE